MTVVNLMRAAVLDRDGVIVERIAIPKPKRGEVLIRIAGCGVCHSDLHVVTGEIPFPRPCVIGHEISGSVEAHGEGVEDIAPPIGSNVVCAFVMPCGSCRHCVRGRDDLCLEFFRLNRTHGRLYDGTTRLARTDGTPLWMFSMSGMAEYAVVPATDVFALPAALPVLDSAIIGCALFTAYGAIRHAADLRVGERVAVIAVGGVGSNLIQLARAFGASQIIAVDVSDNKLTAAMALGATETVNSEVEDAVATVREATAGEGVDVAFEALGQAATFTQAIDLVRDGGRMVPVGLGNGAATVPITRVVRGRVAIIGSYGARTRTDMPVLLDLTARGVANPSDIVSRYVQIEDVNEAFGALTRGEILGRAVMALNG